MRKSLCLVTLFFILTLPAFGTEVVFDDPVDLCETLPGGCQWSIALDEDNIYGIRFDRRVPWRPVLFTRSFDGGNTFEEPREITQVGNGEEVSLSFITEAGVIHFVFTRTISRITYCRSEDQGDSFQCRDWSGLELGFQSEIHLRASGQTLYIGFGNIPPMSAVQVFLIASTDAGKTFGPIQNVSNRPDTACGLRDFSAFGNTIYMTIQCGNEPRKFFRGHVE